MSEDFPDRTIANESPDSFHVRGTGNSHQQIVHSPRDSRWYAGLLGASIVVNIICMMAMFWDKQEKRIDEEYHIQTQGGIDRLDARVIQLEKAGPITIIVRHEASKDK